MSDENTQIDAAATFGDEYIGGKSDRPKTVYYKLTNKSPTGEQKHPAGKIVRLDDGAVLDSVNVTLLYFSNVRAVKRKQPDGKMKCTCQSHDGVFPSARVESPFCKSATSAAVAQQLTKLKSLGADKAKLQMALTEVTQGGILHQCCWKDKSGFSYPLCPAAHKDQYGNPAACKAGALIIAYDHDRDMQFRMDLGGLNLQNYGGYVSPLRQFQVHVRENKIPYYELVLTLKPVEGPRGFYVLGIGISRTLNSEQDSELINKFKLLYENAKNDYLASAVWAPKKEAQTAVASADTTPADDINF